MPELTKTDDVRRALESARTIAVVGAHVVPAKAAYYVPEYLHSQGYRILSVNPGFVGRELWDNPVHQTLAELDEPVDLVDVFRRSDRVPVHLDDILAMDPLPKTVWLQLGIRNAEVAARLIEAGIDVVQDRCTLADHQAMGIPAIG